MQDGECKGLPLLIFTDGHTETAEQAIALVLPAMKQGPVVGVPERTERNFVSKDIFPPRYEVVIGMTTAELKTEGEHGSALTEPLDGNE